MSWASELEKIEQINGRPWPHYPCGNLARSGTGPGCHGLACRLEKEGKASTHLSQMSAVLTRPSGDGSRTGNAANRKLFSRAQQQI